MRYSRDISLLCFRLKSRKAVYLALRITTTQKVWNVYSICSLYSSVQSVEIPPFLHKELWLIDSSFLYNKREITLRLSPPLNIIAICYFLCEITESIKPYSKASSALIKLSLSVSLSISSILRPVFSAKMRFNLCLFFCICSDIIRISLACP